MTKAVHATCARIGARSCRTLAVHQEEPAATIRGVDELSVRLVTSASSAAFADVERMHRGSAELEQLLAKSERRADGGRARQRVVEAKPARQGLEPSGGEGYE